MYQPNQQGNSALRTTASVRDAGSDAMLNESSPRHTQRAALLPDDLAAAHPAGADVHGDSLLDSKASTLHPGGPTIYRKSVFAIGRRIAIAAIGGLRHRTGGRNMKRNETHMNRGIGTLWVYWPAIVATTSLALGTLIYIISNSRMGSNISLMFQTLI